MPTTSTLRGCRGWRGTTVPLNGLAAAQILDLLGDAPVGANRLLVTGAAGAVGGYLLALTQDRGWRVTGLARTEDETFVHSLGASFTDRAEPGWDAVVDLAALRQQALDLVRDGGKYVGVRPGAEPAAERGITVTVLITHPDGPRLADLLARAANGTLPTRIHSVLPLDQADDAHRTMAKGGVRGRIVLTPDRGADVVRKIDADPGTARLVADLSNADYVASRLPGSK